jgi:hypothetical protein
MQQQPADGRVVYVSAPGCAVQEFGGNHDGKGKEGVDLESYFKQLDVYFGVAKGGADLTLNFSEKFPAR